MADSIMSPHGSGGMNAKCRCTLMQHGGGTTGQGSNRGTCLHGSQYDTAVIMRQAVQSLCIDSRALLRKTKVLAPQVEEKMTAKCVPGTHTIPHGGGTADAHACISQLPS